MTDISDSARELQTTPRCIRRDDIGRAGQLPAFYVPPKPPLKPGAFGVDIEVVVRSAQTEYQYCSVETALAPKTLGPSPHLHKELDEISFVLEGTLSVYVDGTVTEVRAGGTHMRPRGLIHSFWNGTDKPIRFVDTFLNQNFDDYLEEFFTILRDAERSDLGHQDPAIAQRQETLDREFDVVWFHEQRQSIVEQYELKG